MPIENFSSTPTTFRGNSHHFSGNSPDLKVNSHYFSDNSPDLKVNSHHFSDNSPDLKVRKVGLPPLVALHKLSGPTLSWAVVRVGPGRGQAHLPNLRGSGRS